MKSLLRSIARWWEWRTLLRRPGDEILGNAFLHVQRTAHKDALLTLTIAGSRVRHAPLIELIAKANRDNRHAENARRTATGLLGTAADRGAVARSDQALGDVATPHSGTADRLHLRDAAVPALAQSERDAVDVAPPPRGPGEIHERIAELAITKRLPFTLLDYGVPPGPAFRATSPARLEWN